MSGWDDPRYTWGPGDQNNIYDPARDGPVTPPPASPAAPPPPPAPVVPQPSAPTPPPAPDPTTTPDPKANQNAIDMVKAAFPWIEQLGLTDQLKQWVADGITTGDAIVAEVRQTGQWKARFAGIRRDDDTLRMNEAQYLQREDDYRSLFKQFGRADYEYDQPSDFVAVFKNDIDPNELKQRLDTYDQIQRSSDDVKAAFYVYAGMKVTDDDLYQTTVSPGFAAELQGQYTAMAAKTNLDYQTFITRATEVGLELSANTLTRLSDAGVVGSHALMTLPAQNPEHVRLVTDQLYHGGDATGGAQGRFLNLDELLHSLQYALIGSAASANGLALPDKERLEQFRQAGVDRARASEVYGQLARTQGQLQGSLQRAGFGRFTQDDFERALFLNQATPSQQLAQAQAQEKALGDAGGSAGFSADQSGRLRQRGLTPVAV